MQIPIVRRGGAAIQIVEQATPVITIDETGLITATSEQPEGFVEEGTKLSTLQIPNASGVEF